MKVRTKNRQLVILIGVMASAIGAGGKVWAQPAVLPSQRLVIPGQTQGTEAGAAAAVADMMSPNGDSSFPPNVTDADPLHAVSAQSASVTIGGALASAQTLFQAMCLIQPGNTDFVPQVDTTGSATASASAGETEFADCEWSGGAVARATFQVVANPSEPSVTTGQLRASLYLVATGGETGSAWLNDATLTASAGATNVGANNFGGTGWNVNGFIADDSDPAGGTFLMEFWPGGMNHLYVGTETAGIGNTYFVTAAIAGNTAGDLLNLASGGAGAGGMNPSGAVNRGFSASAWYSIH